MAAEHLPDEMKAAGKAMLEELDAIGLEPQAVMWVFFESIEEWRLCVVSPLVETLGRRKVYALLDGALEKIGPVAGLTIMDVHLYAPDENMARTMSIIKVEDAELKLSHVRFASAAMDRGAMVNALVYRMRDPVTGAALRELTRRFQKAAKAFVMA